MENVVGVKCELFNGNRLDFAKFWRRGGGAWLSLVHYFIFILFIIIALSIVLNFLAGIAH